jgi:hypothetical protein
MTRTQKIIALAIVLILAIGCLVTCCIIGTSNEPAETTPSVTTAAPDTTVPDTTVPDTTVPAPETVSIPSTVTSIDDFTFSRCYSITKINFNGTSAKWNAIQKGDAWDNLLENYTVYCTDGNIAK